MILQLLCVLDSRTDLCSFEGPANYVHHNWLMLVKMQIKIEAIYAMGVFTKTLLSVGDILYACQSTGFRGALV